MVEISKGFDYIKSTAGVLKIFELIALLISISCMSGFMNALSNSKGTWEFFLCTMVVSWILTAGVFFFFVFGLHERFTSVNWPLVVGIVFMIFSLLQLIASSIIADNARNYKDSGICDGWRAVSGAIDCNNLVVAAIFGFISFVLYVLDTLLHFWLSVVAERGNVISEETAEMDSGAPAAEEA